MTTREYLSKIRRYDRMIENKLEDIKNLRSILLGTSSNTEIERVQTSGSKDKVCEFVSKIIDSEKEVDAFIDSRYDIIHMIEEIEDTDMYDVLTKRYVLGKDFKVIASEMQKSLRQVFQISEKAHDLFEKKYGALYLKK